MGIESYTDTINALSGIDRKQRADAANRQAGNALAGGDYTGAANALYRNGDLQNGMAVVNAGQAQDAAARQREADATLKLTKGIRTLVGSGMDPQAAYDEAIKYAPALGLDPQSVQTFAGMRQRYTENPKAFLDVLDQQVQKELQFFQTDTGILAGDKGTGRVSLAYGLPGKPIEMDPTKNYLVRDTPVGPPGAPAATNPPVQAASPGQVAPDQPIPTARPSADAVFSSIIQQESGGKPGVTGPKTQYGQAQGAAQLLPATAQAMAQKLGLPWRPDLMTATTPEAQDYQTKLGRAYFDEGLQKYGGDVQKAASYYYAGPNEKLWGPKTQAYTQAVLQRAGGTPTLQGGSGSDALSQDQQAPPGYRYLQRAQADGGDAGGLEDSTLDLLAGRYLIDGTTPPLGQGKVGSENRARFFNRVAALAKTTGIDAGDLVAGTASTKALAKGLTNLTNIKAQITASEMTVVRNADYALSLAPQAAGPTRMPVFDRWIQAGRKATGDADVAQFNAALGTVADEYAKVMSSNTGSGGVTSDSARAEARSRLNSAMNQQQLQKVVTAMKTEMANRVSSMSEVEANLRAKLHGGAAPAAAPSVAPSPAPGGQPRIRRYNPATRQLEG